MSIRRFKYPVIHHKTCIVARLPRIYSYLEAFTMITYLEIFFLIAANYIHFT